MWITFLALSTQEEVSCHDGCPTLLERNIQAMGEVTSTMGAPQVRMVCIRCCRFAKLKAIKVCYQKQSCMVHIPSVFLSRLLVGTPDHLKRHRSVRGGICIVLRSSTSAAVTLLLLDTHQKFVNQARVRVCHNPPSGTNVTSSLFHS
jgi:hypothetical protein